MKIKVPYLKWRDGRPRWEPSPRLRDQGFKGVDLKDKQGNWLPLDLAAVEANALTNHAKKKNKTYREKRFVGNKPTVQYVWERFTTTPEFLNKKEKTRRDYLSKSNKFLDLFGDIPIAHVRRKDIKAFWRKLHDENGHHMANGVIAVFRLMLTYALDEEFVGENVATNLRLTQPKPRVVIFTPTELECLVSTADRLGQFGVGDAIVLAVHTAQRQADILAATWRAFEDGEVKVKQFKVGVNVNFPQSAVLAARLAEIRTRQSNRVVNYHEVIIDDNTGRPFENSTFRHRFADVRKTAAAVMPSIETKKFLDLRDTALTRLYGAEVELLDIASISGHSVKSVHTVIRHYIALSAGDSKRAISKLDQYIKEKNIKV